MRRVQIQAVSLTLQPWGNYLMSLDLSFLTCKTRTKKEGTSFLVLWKLTEWLFVKHLGKCLAHSRHYVSDSLIQVWFTLRSLISPRKSSPRSPIYSPLCLLNYKADRTDRTRGRTLEPDWLDLYPWPSCSNFHILCHLYYLLVSQSSSVNQGWYYSI